MLTSRGFTINLRSIVDDIDADKGDISYSNFTYCIPMESIQQHHSERTIHIMSHEDYDPSAHLHELLDNRSISDDKPLLRGGEQANLLQYVK